MLQAPVESASNIRDRNIVPAAAYALTDASDRLRRRREPEVVQFDRITEISRSAKHVDVSAPTQRAFERKRFQLRNRFVNFAQQQPARLECARRRIERRQAPREFVGIEKAQAFDLVREIFARKRRFTRAVAASNNVDGRRSFRHSANRVWQAQCPFELDGQR